MQEQKLCMPTISHANYTNSSLPSSSSASSVISSNSHTNNSKLILESDSFLSRLVSSSSEKFNNLNSNFTASNLNGCNEGYNVNSNMPIGLNNNQSMINNGALNYNSYNNCVSNNLENNLNYHSNSGATSILSNTTDPSNWVFGSSQAHQTSNIPHNIHYNTIQNHHQMILHGMMQ